MMMMMKHRSGKIAMTAEMSRKMMVSPIHNCRNQIQSVAAAAAVLAW